MKWLIFLLALTVLLSCQRAKEKGREVVSKSVAKVKKTGERVFVSTVQGAYKALTVDKPTSFDETLGKRDSLNVEEKAGLRVDFPISFYSCFLQYRADKDTILNFIATQPTGLPAMSDTTFSRTDTTQLFKHLRFMETEYPDLMGKLGFFYEIRRKKNIAYYRCNRYPHAHLIAYDPSTKIIYHHIERYWD